TSRNPSPAGRQPWPPDRPVGEPGAAARGTTRDLTMSNPPTRGATPDVRQRSVPDEHPVMQATNPRISVLTARQRRPEPDLPPAHNYPVPTKRPTLGGPNPPALLTHRHSISVSSDRNACPCAAATAWAVVPLTTL